MYDRLNADKKLIKQMSEELVQASPPRLKKNQLLSTPSLHKSKAHLPSRYAQPIKQQNSRSHHIFTAIESQVKQNPVQKQHPFDASPKPVPHFTFNTDLKMQNSFQFKSKPMKREDNDMAKFQQIFLNPREETLKSLRRFEQKHQNPNTIVKQYQNALKIERGWQIETQESEKGQPSIIRQSYEQAIELLESGGESVSSVKRLEQDEFYEAQITVDPPNSNSTASLASNPKPILSASLPQNYKSYKDLNLKQLLLRAKAGMNSEDIEKQAHLSFYLGEVYSEKKYFKLALKFFRRFLGLAKMMEDRVGMIVGANRVGFSYFNCREYQKSILFHNENLRLSDRDNLFFGLYNIGICCRKLKKLSEALEYFESALNWAQENGEDESQCIALGQLAVTYKQMEQFQQSIQRFQQSYVICEKIKKKNLKLINLWNILRVASVLKTKTNDQLNKIAKDAFECAKQLGQVSSLDIFRCNIGILTGTDDFYRHFGPRLNQLQQEIQEIDQ